ncbi:MAG: putative glycoside hydrolase [Promethearchaeota archaeon]
MQKTQIEIRKQNDKMKYLIFFLLLLLSITILPISSGTTNISSTRSSILSSGAFLQINNSIINNPITLDSNTIFETFDIDLQMFATSRFSANTYATKSDVWVGHYDQLSIVPKIHQINQNITCLLYRNIRLVWAPGSYEYKESEYQLFVENGWILTGSSGDYVNINNQAYMVDIGNFSYQQWLADWVKNYLDTYNADGVFLDNCAPNGEIAYGVSEYPQNPRTGKSWTTNEFTQAVITLVNTVKNSINPRLVLGNTIFSGTHFFRSDLHNTYVDFLANSKIDGILSEGWISSFTTSDWYSEEKWKQGIDMAIWIEENFLSKDQKIFWTMSDNAGLIWPEGEVRLPVNVTKEQYVTYAYASRLLTINYSHKGNWMNFGVYTPEDYPQNLLKTNIGLPSSDYQKSGFVYVREFANGLVIVNPTTSSHQYDLNGIYREALQGTSISSAIIIPEHTGLILEKI